MRERYPNLIVPIGTQVVTRIEFIPSGGGTPLPKGIVGELIKAPADSTHAYRVRFPDGGRGKSETARILAAKALQDWTAG